MKRIYLLMIAMLAFVATWSQTTYYWQPGAGGAWTTAANWNTAANGSGSTRGTTLTSDILVIDKGTTMTITAIPNQTVGRLSVLSGVVTFQSPSGLQTLTIANGASATDFVVASGATLIQDISTNEIALANSAAADISGTYQINNAVTFSFGTSSTASVSGRIDLNTGIIDFNTNAVMTVTGTLDNTSGTFSNLTATRLVFTGGRYIHDMNGGTVPTAGWNAGSTVEIAAMTTAYPGGMTQTFRNLEFTSTITTDINIGSSITTLGDLTINIGFGAGDDLILTNSNTNRAVTVGGKFTLASGVFVLDEDNGGSTLSVAGDFVMTGGTLTETGSNSVTVNFDGTSTQTFTKSGGTISNNVNFDVNGGATVDFGTSILNGTSGTFDLSSNAKLITSNSGGIATTGATGSIQTAGLRTYSSTADYEFRGAITGNFTTASNTVRNLTINSATSGAVTLSNTRIVTGVLAMANGYLTTTAGQLTLSTSGTMTSANNSYVNGQITKQTNSTAKFTFYIGKLAGGGIRQMAVTPSSTNTTTWVAEFMKANPQASVTNGAVLGSGISIVSACEYWVLNRTGGTANGAVMISWNANSNCGPRNYVTQPMTLRVAQHNGAAWQDAGTAAGGDAGSSVTSGTITSSAVTTFSATRIFALGSSTTADNPLPVLFAEVRAYLKTGGIQVEWSNLTERDVIKYDVERSTNGFDFFIINTQLPKSNRDDKASYTHFDANPALGANYYRVKVIEENGKIVYSKILKVETSTTKASFGIYPNPVVGTTATLSLSGVRQGQYMLRVINSVGQEIYHATINNAGDGVTQMLELPASIKPGMYTGVISGQEYRSSQIFIVK